MNYEKDKDMYILQCKAKPADWHDNYYNNYAYSPALLENIPPTRTPAHQQEMFVQLAKSVVCCLI